MLSPKQKRNFGKIIPFGLIWSVFALLYVFLEYGLLQGTRVYPTTNNPYHFYSSLIIAPLACFFIGILVGLLEVYFLNSLFSHKKFWQKIAFKTVIYLLIFVVFFFAIALVLNSINLSKNLFHPEVIHSAFQFTSHFVFISLVIYSGVITILCLFIFEVTDYLGGSVFNNFFTGKYHHPIEEERIFMFLDMKSSTTIAEKLGHVNYFQLLNNYYADLTEVIIETNGEIYQYAGDEVIVSWPLEKGLQKLYCIQCFFGIKKKIQSMSKNYIDKFGLVPSFKAGFHSGKVTTGEIGTLKKEIFFTGDVLNTTARIQAKCNDLGTDLLISEELISHLNLGENYNITTFGKFDLRGKEEQINLYSLEKIE